MAPKKLTSKRARKTTAEEGSSIAPPVKFEFDGHHFRRLVFTSKRARKTTAEEVIKDWFFLKERKVQLAEGEYLEF